MTCCQFPTQAGGRNAAESVLAPYIEPEFKVFPTCEKLVVIVT